MKLVITRPLEYAQEFIDLLDQNDIGHFLLPCLEFAKPSDDYSSLDKAIRSNHEYDWIIFLSKKSAEIFFDRLLELGGHLFHLSPRLKIACVGESTASFIRNEIGFPVDFVPTKFNSKCFLQEFNPDKVSGVILVRNEIVEDDFINDLNSRVVAIDLALAYKTQVPDLDLTEFDQFLSLNHQLCFSFTSSQTVRNFKKSLGPERIERLNGIKAISIGPRTTETIESELSSMTIIEAKSASLAAIVDAILLINV